MSPKVVFDRQKAKVKNWDNERTPLEIAAELDAHPELPFIIAHLLRVGERPVSYLREDWSEHATYYKSRKPAKRLIVAFATGKNTLGVPISYFLQMLRDDLFEVIVLRDPRGLHYTHGVRGLGSFFESMTQIKEFAEARGFQEIITFGASYGGIPALRAGRLLGARRAISIGGGYPWHPGRLIRGETPVYAFDPLCACASPGPTELVLVYARRNETDRNANKLLKKTFPACTAVGISTNEHNLLGYFYMARLLPLLFACLFEWWEENSSTALLTRLGRTAHHILEEQAQKDERLQHLSSKELEAQEEREARRLAEKRFGLAEKQSRLAEKNSMRLLRELEAVHESCSWRVTLPFRAIKRMLSRQH